MRIAIGRIVNHSYNYSYESRDSFMAYRIHHLNKKTGVIYVYESVARWDKEKNRHEAPKFVSVNSIKKRERSSLQSAARRALSKRMNLLVLQQQRLSALR